MTEQERAIEFHFWVDDLACIIAAWERQQSHEIDIDLTHIAVVADEINHIWKYGADTHRLRLAPLRRRNNEIQRIEHHRPEVDLPPYIPYCGPSLNCPRD